jgi:hypothetical protein
MCFGCENPRPRHGGPPGPKVWGFGVGPARRKRSGAAGGGARETGPRAVKVREDGDSQRDTCHRVAEIREADVARSSQAVSCRGINHRVTSLQELRAGLMSCPGGPLRVGSRCAPPALPVAPGGAAPECDVLQGMP